MVGSGHCGSADGTKTVLNELLAYIDLAKLPDDALSERSRLMMTYALCGFANFGSLGIMIGGLATMAPERRDEIVSLGGKTHRLRNACDLRRRLGRGHSLLSTGFSVKIEI